MSMPDLRGLFPLVIAAPLCSGCMPSRDLDATAAGDERSGGAGALTIGGGSSQSGGAPEAAAGSSAGRADSDGGFAGTALAGGSGSHAGGDAATDGGALPALGGAGGWSGSPAGAAGTAPSVGGSVGFGGAEGGGAGSGAAGTGASGGFGDGNGGAGSIGGVPGDGGSSFAGSSGVAGAGGSELPPGGAGSHGGQSGGGGVAGEGGTGGAPIAPDLPDIPNSPVAGGINYSDEATWDIDGEQVPAFEIHTPTASYWLVKSAGALVEITDNRGRKWISFSSGYRPNRGVPNLGGCCQPGDPATLGMPEMITSVDPQSVTLSHLRLVSKPVDGEYYWLVWDFYLTHVTVTINRAAEPFGFTYHGVPGGNLDDTDQLVLSSGEAQSAKVGFLGDLEGPAEWVYLTSPSAAANSSLFLIQHGDDSLPESYGVADGNSSRFVFGSGQVTRKPIRYSLGVVPTIAHEAVSERVAFVIDNIPP